MFKHQELTHTYTAACVYHTDDNAARALQQGWQLVRYIEQTAVNQTQCPLAHWLSIWLVQTAWHQQRHTTSDCWLLTKDHSQLGSRWLGVLLPMSNHGRDSQGEYRNNSVMVLNMAKISSDKKTVTCRSHVDMTVLLTTFSWPSVYDTLFAMLYYVIVSCSMCSGLIFLTVSVLQCD